MSREFWRFDIPTPECPNYSEFDTIQMSVSEIAPKVCLLSEVDTQAIDPKPRELLEVRFGKSMV